MSSYYTRVEGSLESGKTARADDIHLIQSNIQEMIHDVIVDMFGPGFILGETENAFKLYGISSGNDEHIFIDQKNTTINETLHWISFYAMYLKQPIDIEKSAIDTVRVHMFNDTNIPTTIYAEIHDEDGNNLQTASALLEPSQQDKYNIVDFHFNLKHLHVGRYYLIIRPVDISSTDLARVGDGEIINEIKDSDFCIKYDADGGYNQGLQLSTDGDTYVDAYKFEGAILPPRDDITISESINEVSIDEEANPDLYFEEIYSSGDTYIVDDNTAAVVLGKKVYPLDTHVTIDAASTKGYRTDLVILTSDGELKVKNGEVYTSLDDPMYPTDDTGLSIAYITNFPAQQKKVPMIEQNDDNGTTRHRDVLERLRRIEKKIDYQFQNNAPTRIKFNFTVDPILGNNEDDTMYNNTSTRVGEGTYNMSSKTDSNGNLVMVNQETHNLAWSIIDNNYTYNVKTHTNKNVKIEVYDIYTTTKKPDKYDSAPGIYKYYLHMTEQSKEQAVDVKKAKVKIKIKKNGKTKKTYTLDTNKNGVISFTLFKLKLAAGTYNVYTTYGKKIIHTKLYVYGDKDKLKKKSPKKTTEYIEEQIDGVTITHTLPTGMISGDDTFYKDNVVVDTDVGEVRMKKITNISDNYEINSGRALLKDTKTYDKAEKAYVIKGKSKKTTSKFPALHVTFDREVYIKSITPYISGFKNIKSFGIILFKNDEILNNVKRKNKTFRKKIGKGKVDTKSPDDDTFPTLYKSEQKSLKDLTKKSGNYKTLKKQITFDDVNLDLEAGTYTIMILPKLTSSKKEGKIRIKEYSTKKDTNIYGMAGSCNGNVGSSVISMDTSSLSDNSWDIAIKHKTYKYYDTGTLISPPYKMAKNFKKCTVNKNFKIPSNCEIKLFASNDGGSNYKEMEEKNTINFDAGNNSFRWKLVMKSNTISTPKLKFNHQKQYAISFNLIMGETNDSYEDYKLCYESPLLNANYITRTQTTRSPTSSTFKEWEFTRIFMEDETLSNKIDILISYSDSNNIGQETSKDSWQPIFFSTVFADLTLKDFSRESIEYDNYEGNIEYDEYNYKYRLNSEEIMNYSNNLSLASPIIESNINQEKFQKTSGEYEYGDINTESLKAKNLFTYTPYDVPYKYVGNDTESTKYSGMHIEKGPYILAQRTDKTGDLSASDTIIGVHFTNGLQVNENITHLTIGLMPIKGTTTTGTTTTDTTTTGTTTTDTTTTGTTGTFPSGTFKIALSLGKHGEIESGNNSIGREFIINQELQSGEYTEVTVDFIDDLAGFQASGINSIGIKAAKPGNIATNDGIGIGRISSGSYNRRPYVPYAYTGENKRFTWKGLKTDCQPYVIYKLGKKSGSTDIAPQRIFYPLTAQSGNNTETLTSIKHAKSGGLTNLNDINGDKLYAWRNDSKDGEQGTGKLQVGKFTMGANKSKITKNKGQIKTTLYYGANDIRTYTTTNSGNEVLLEFPEDTTGELFEIKTNIPFTIYDLIDVEYYVFSQCYEPSTVTNSPYQNALSAISSKDNAIHYATYKNEDNNNNIYVTDGAFSKGDIMIDLHDNEGVVESFALPAWGRIAMQSNVVNKVVHAWFKKRSNATKITKIVVRRANPRKGKVLPIKLVLNNILFYNATDVPALGPQMQVRIYPMDGAIGNNTYIRKIGGVYRI